jgi:spermidine/putrescine transport system ATP-binding protein
VIPDVEFVGVSKRFGAQPAVDDISFAVLAGGFFSLLGPSGCGKSTKLRMISGFEEPDRGEIRIAGADMRHVAPNRRPTNMVFQRWALFPHMTVWDNVAFGLVVERTRRDEIRRRVQEALALVGLADRAGNKPGQLSGGQMQRVALARALVKRPKVLLLDEPLGALDLKLRGQLQLELKRIQREVGTTFVYVTHDQGEAMTMSDTIAVMNAGRIEQIGAPREIYDHPATRFVAAFIGDTNFLPVAVESVADGIARVRLGDFAFAAAVSQRPAGATGQVSIRYERIRIGPAARALAATLLARVCETIFSGSSVHYTLALGGSDRRIVAEVPYDGAHSLLEPGAAVELGWDADAARLFADD